MFFFIIIIMLKQLLFRFKFLEIFSSLTNFFNFFLF